MGRLEEIGRELLALHREAQDIAEERFRAKMQAINALVGRTYVWRNNCYSCPEPGESWDLFRRIVAIVDKKSYALLICEDVSIDHCGTVKIQLDTQIVTDLMDWPIGKWEACVQSEFWDLRAAALEQLENPTRIVAAQDGK